MANDFGMRAVLTADITSFEGAMLAAFNIAKSFATSFANVMETSIKRVSESFKESGNFDITIGSFQKLKFAADQTNTSMSTLQMAARQMQKQIGEATFGNKQSQTLLQRLGLDPKELARNPLDEQFRKVADALKDIQNTTQANDIAMRLFGRSGTQAIQFLKELADQSMRFDLLLKPQTEPEGSDIWSAKQALGEISAIIDNIWNQLASKFATPLTNIIHMFEDWGFTGRNLSSTLDDIYDGFKKMTYAGIQAGLFLRDSFNLIADAATGALLKIQMTKDILTGLAGGALLNNQKLQDILKGAAGGGMLEFSLNKNMKDAKSLYDEIFKDLPFTPRGRNGNQELEDAKSNPVGYALQITSAANIPSMQLAAKEVQEVHAPGVEKAVDRVRDAIDEFNSHALGIGFAP